MKTKSNKSIEDIVYGSIILELDYLENKGAYRGNSHHLAQRLSYMVSAGLLPKNQKKIYDALTESPAPVKEISKQCGMISRVVSAQLHQMRKSTILINFRRDKKNKLWYRVNTK